MKHNIIKMTATAGLTVPHSINQIFQYIFEFQKLKRMTWTTFGFNRTGPHSQCKNLSFAHRY